MLNVLDVLLATAEYFFFLLLWWSECVWWRGSHTKNEKGNICRQFIFFFSPPHIFFYDDFLSRSCYDPAVPQLTLSLTSCLVWIVDGGRAFPSFPPSPSLKMTRKCGHLSEIEDGRGNNRFLHEFTTLFYINLCFVINIFRLLFLWLCQHHQGSI